MANNFSPNITRLIELGRNEARRLESQDIAPEHLLLGMLLHTDGPGMNLLRRMHLQATPLRSQLEERVRKNKRAYSDSGQLNISEQTNNILKLAVLEARRQHENVVDEQHVLLAMLRDSTNNGAKNALEMNNIDYNSIYQMVYSPQHSGTKDGISLPEDEEEDEPETTGQQDSNAAGSSKTSGTQTKQAKGNNGTPVIDNYGTDLTTAAAQEHLDPVVGREREIQRVVEILGRRKKNNPILIGEPGVGKSAIVEGLAQLIAQHKTSPALFGKRIVSLDLSGLVAGTKYRGQFEERIKALIKELETHKEIIIFIDEIHTLIGAGSAAGTMDAANILKPALARGTIQCIGATTLDEFRNSIEKDGALDRRFQKVQVEPSTAEETLQILRNIKDRYEHHHHVNYTDEALKACVRLTERYITDRAFPDKAIDALDEVGSRLHLLNVQIPPEITETEKEIAEVKEKKQAAVKGQNFELAASYRDRQTELENQLKEMRDKLENGSQEDRQPVTEHDVAEVVSMMSGVPADRMAEAEGLKLKNMAQELKDTVIAQDAAIDKMVRAILRNRVGLKEPNHPIGAFMFLGPTGVGKTYLAKKLAEKMFGSADALIRIDMSEYGESFNVSRLVGAPPGYVGYEEGGQLTERVRRHPYSIVLLDEIEKAHQGVFNLLLQVLDEGRLTDGNGRQIDFRNTVIIMTSNAGTRRLKEFAHGVGFTAGGFSGSEKDKEYASSVIQKSLSRQFAPEFLNRLDEIITFDQLDMQAIKRIVDTELKGLLKRVADLGYNLQLTDAAKELLAQKGYDVQFGARPLKRAIQTYVEDGLCQLLLEDNAPAEGAHITADKADGKEELTFFVN